MRRNDDASETANLNAPARLIRNWFRSQMRMAATMLLLSLPVTAHAQDADYGYSEEAEAAAADDSEEIDFRGQMQSQQCRRDGMFGFATTGYMVNRISGPSAQTIRFSQFFSESATMRLAEGDQLVLCNSDGREFILSGPATIPLSVLAEDPDQYAAEGPPANPTGASSGNGGYVRSYSLESPPAASPPPPPPPPPAPVALPARTGIPAYPVWPPETPSSRVGLDRFIASRAGMSLYDAGEKLKGAFDGAGYVEHSYYAAPGGFVLVTRIEKIGADGAALKGAERYELPNQRSDPSLTDYVRNLFLEAPPGFYRYIAVVVSDRPFATSARTLNDDDAIARLRRGSNDLSAVYKTVPFTRAHKVEALIYEFRKDGGDGKVSMIEPGRIGAQIHLAKTGLDRSVRSAFAR
ncbi:MAG: hypothetical protein R3E02_07125 [Blastomonas sp.]